MYWMYCLCIRVHNTFAIRQQIWEHFLAQTQFCQGWEFANRFLSELLVFYEKMSK